MNDRCLRGLTLVEVLAGVSIFAVAVLVAVAALTALSRAQQVALYRAQAATLAMAIGQYRAADMIRLAALRVAATTYGGDLPTYGSGDAIYAYWNSVSYRQTAAATFHGAVLTAATPGTTTASNTVTKSAATGSAWLDGCPLFRRCTNNVFNDAGTSYTQGGTLVAFTSQDAFQHVQPPTFVAGTTRVTSWGTFRLKGGSPADMNFNRLYLVNPAALAGGSLESYRTVGVTFSQPSDQAVWDGVAIKARFLVASFWLCPPDFVTVSAYKQPVSGAGCGTLTFLGRYLILDALEP